MIGLMLLMPIILFFVVIIFWVFGTYNALIYKRNMIDNAFSSMDVYLKKRYDLIPNLVEIAKEYMEYEKDTLEKIVELRSNVLNEKNSDTANSINKEISTLMGKVMVAVENYPELKANDQFVFLLKSLNEVEEQISAARRTYNSAVTAYNTYVEMAPSNVIAAMFNFTKRDLFEINSEERENINIKNLF